MGPRKVGAQFMTGTFANKTTLDTIPDKPVAAPACEPR
jgi:hypothetical protein